MKQKKAYRHLLVADMHRAICLGSMQLEIEQGNFDAAMRCQLSYLYWYDEFDRLYKKYKDKHLKLITDIHGRRL